MSSIRLVIEMDLFINGGFFALRKEIFDYMKLGEELVVEFFCWLIVERKLMGYCYDCFWVMDMFKEQ